MKDCIMGNSMEKIELYLRIKDRKMKKTFLILLCMFTFTFAFSMANGRILSGGSIGTGAIFYGNSTNLSEVSDFSRFIVEGDLFAAFVLDESVNFNAGVVSVWDFHFHDKQHYILGDYGFYGGARVYPGLMGLCVGVDYILGRRTDFISLKDENVTNGIFSTAWGNGFRFLVEYDFTYGGVGFAPVIGASWRQMPRGGSADNILSIYFRMSYR